MRKTILAQAEQSSRVLSLLGAVAFPVLLIVLFSGKLQAASLLDPAVLATSVASLPHTSGASSASLALTTGANSSAGEMPDQLPAATPALPAAARHITLKGCLEFTDYLIPGAFVIWCRPCDQVCIVILQEGVDDRAIIRVPDAPLDSPIRSFSAGDYSVHRSSSGIGIRVVDAKPLSE
jgi:hypothetical protein